jgi:hypothetical protein
MSSNDIYESEEVIDLFSQSVTPQALTDNESADDVKAEITAVLVGTTESTTILNVDGVYDVLASQNDSSQGWKDDPNELPSIARNLTWHDPFYENRTDVNDIIMTFDIDRRKYDTFILSPLLAIFFMAAIISLWLGYFEFVIGITILSSGPMIFACINNCIHRQEQLNVKCLHVALTRNGIYVDVVNKPDGHHHMIRTKIPYRQIKACVTTVERSCWGGTANYKIRVYRKEKFPVFVIDGIESPQRFLDVVGAMMKWSSDVTTDVETPSCSHI